MATTKKKATGEAVGLRQSSLLVFFPKPSARPPLETTQQQWPPALADELSHSSTQDASFSSCTNDDAHNLRWSQLLSGNETWSSASVLPVLSTSTELHEEHHENERDNEIFLSTTKKRHSYPAALGPPSQSTGKKLHTEEFSVSDNILEEANKGTNPGSSLGCSGRADNKNLTSFVAPDNGCPRQHSPSEDVAPDNGCLRQHSPSQDADKSLYTKMDFGDAFMDQCFEAQNPNSYKGHCFHVQPSSDAKENLNISKLVVSTPKPAASRNVLSPSDLKSPSGELLAEDSITATVLPFDPNCLEPGPGNDVCTLEEKHVVQPDVKKRCHTEIQEALSADGKCTETLRHVKFEELESHEDNANHSHGVSGVYAGLGIFPEGGLPLFSLKATAKHSKATSRDVKARFMKVKRASGRRVTAIEEPMEAPITDYEREREENILRNQHFLQKLGISSSALSHVKVPSCASVKLRGKAISKVKVRPSLPLRRSRRLLQEPGDAHTMEDQKKEESLTDPPREEEDFCYDDSSVLRYACEGLVSSLVFPELSSINDVGNILGFRPSNRLLEDAYLTRIYTMSSCFVSQTHRTLLAAGGHQGHIAIFGTSCCYDVDCSLPMVVDNDVPEELGSLVSWKASSSWISGVKLLSTPTRENAMLLLSSSNDGSLVLWDVSKQQTNQQSAMRMANMPPLKVTEATGIHSRGIFSMHEFLGHVVTASKDSTVGSSRITEQTILTERSIGGHHRGAIRGVNFRDASTIADCGADGLICVLDLRMGEPCVLSVDTADATGVNAVEWCPLQEHLLLSASRDPQILLHDIRNAKEPLYKLSGHVNPKVQRCSHIYRPTFIAQGSAVASPGQGSKALSLYSVKTGKAISRGHLGYDPTMVMWTTGGDASASTLWVASRNVSQLVPIWQTYSE